MKTKTWKVGVLAAETGTTVRTLHHYEEIGLLTPSFRTDSGHRVYGETDIVRLQQILSLKQLGFPLDDIRVCLVERKMSPLEVVRLHRARIREDRDRVSDLHDRLSRLENALASNEQVSVEEFLKTIEAIHMVEKYYTKEQLKELEDRRNALGPETMESYQRAWPELIDKVRAEMKNGTDPAAPHVRELARQWNALIEAFTGGNPGIRQSLENLYRSEPTVSQANGIDPALGAYVAKMLSTKK